MLNSHDALPQSLSDDNLAKLMQFMQRMQLGEQLRPFYTPFDPMPQQPQRSEQPTIILTTRLSNITSD